MQRGNGQTPSQQSADIIHSVLAAAAASGMNQNPGGTSSTHNQLQLIMAQQHQLVNPAVAINTQQPGSQLRSVQGSPMSANFVGQATQQPSFIKVPVSPSGSILEATSPVQSVTTTGQAPLLLQHGRLLQLPQTVNMVTSSPQTIQTLQFQNTQGCISVPQLNTTMSIPVALSNQLTTQKRTSGASPGRSSNSRKSPISATGNPSHASHMPSHPSKMLKMQVQLPDNPRSDDLLELRRCVLLRKERELKELKENYTENLIELFFLQKDGNMMDFVAYRKRPTPQLVSFLQAQALDGSGGVRRSSSDLHKAKSSSDKISSNSGHTKAIPASVTPSATPGSTGDSRKRTVTQAGLDDSSNSKNEEPPKVKVKEPGSPAAAALESRIEVAGDVPKPLTTTPLPVNQSVPAEIKLKKAVAEPASASSPSTPRPASLASLSTPSSSFVSSQKTSTPSAVPTRLTKTMSAQGGRYTPGRQNSLGPMVAQEKIVERAKQEAQVMQRIGQLRKEGLWTARRLPKVQEPPRHKTHWDYLLEEMQWLAADFAGERRWKKAASRKLVRAVAKYHQERKAKTLKAERDEASRMRRIASNIAKEVKQFWSNIEKVVQYKQQSRLDERRKKALDLQLDFIVGQTEKYSSWLTEGLNVSTAGSSVGSIPSSPTRSTGGGVGDDGEFQPEGDESDDETTIRVEEEEAGANLESEENELKLLEKESQLPIQELLDSLPPEILQKPADLEEIADDSAAAKDSTAKKDDEFVPTDEEEENSVVDDEETLAEQENVEGSQDHKTELDELAADGELSIEELMERYAGAYEEFEAQLDSDDDEEEEQEDDDDDSFTEEYSADESDEYDELEDIDDDDDDDEDDVEEGDENDGEAMDIEYLLNPDKENKQPAEEQSSGDSSPNNEITEFAATAQRIQPTGYTLETTLVKTKVPFLLRHTLREYQHIGLDWLVTMHEKKLNGILADEMGLGKTIQTIAVLAHLACEEGIWGPHLIVVPTSVMLNWEMELKKWCPAFKILTYYGSQKERKQKRQGWTKCNAFHVCVTSYKLVIQDHQAFRRKKWKYLVLDEAQNIKNFKSQRWQTLLNFNSQRRLLLTGTPLQNSLMELWSLMHFLMPHVFQSHREFKEWFSNPVTGMIEGNTDYNEGLIRRLHKVLRPFLLRRLKCEVEKQLPKKYEHIVTCRLSNRQRYLYEDFMSRAKTKETLASGQFLSVINVLMQLRKVCNHPDLFELRPIVSSFTMEGIVYKTASLVLKALEYDPFKHIKFESFNLCLADHELNLAAYAAHRIKQLQTPRALIEEIDSLPDPPERPNKIKVKPGKLFSHIPSKETGRASPFPAASTAASTTTASPSSQASPAVQGRTSPVVSHVLIKTSTGTILQRAAGSSATQGLVLAVSSQQLTRGNTSVSSTTSSSVPSTVTLVSQQAVPSTTQLQQLPGYTIPSGGVLQQRLVLQPQGGGRTQFLTHPITVQLQGQHGTRIALPASQLRQLPQGGIVQIVQTASGQQILRGVQLATTTQVGQSSTSQQLITTSRAGSPQIQLLTQGLRTTAQSPRMTQLLITTSAVGSSGSHVIKSSTAAAQLLSAVNTVSSSGKLHLATSLPASMRPVVRVSPLNADSLPATSASLLSKVSLASSQTKAVTTSGLVLKVAPQPVSSTQASTTSLILNHPSLTTKSITTVSTTMSRKDPTPMAVVSPATTTTPTTSVAPTTTTSSSTDPKLDAKVISTTSDTITTKAATGSVATIVTSLTAPKTSTRSFSKGKSKTDKGKGDDPEAKKSPLYLESIVKHRKDCHKATLTRIADINRWRCGAKPVYGQDLCRAVSIINCLEAPKQLKNIFSGVGYFTCHNTHNHPTPNRANVYFKTTKLLQEAIQKPEVKIQHLQPIFKRFMMTIDPAWASGVSMHTSPTHSSAVVHHNYIQEVLIKELTPRTRCLHALQSATRLQFPELRLIQYDCGKLQTLDVLLRRLKPEGHRVLIFTQMTKMLDVLEKFLNFHGHTYLRLDGATKVESRQILMERFNADKRIFCFILSTRSGGLGINLTGADTVVFYDSDWNPTMDAQAQDRCHRIGQTRDVHIYRLLSEMTVEENILKKANQKRLLADVSIEGGNFTTAFFKKHALSELFEKPEEPDSRGELQVAQSQPTEPKEMPKPDEPKEKVPSKMPETGVATTAKPHLSELQLEQALAKAEDETDVQAASMAHAELDAELAEFDEDIPFDGEEKSGQKEETSRVEMELAQLQDQLTPIEKYALTFLELTVAPLTDEQVKEAEEQVEIAKQEWELSHLQALKEEEERKAEMEEDEIFYTYTREDAYNKVPNKRTGKGVNKKKSALKQSNNRRNVQEVNDKLRRSSRGRSSESQEVNSQLKVQVSVRTTRKGAELSPRSRRSSGAGSDRPLTHSTDKSPESVTRKSRDSSPDRLYKRRSREGSPDLVNRSKSRDNSPTRLRKVSGLVPLKENTDNTLVDTDRNLFLDIGSPDSDLTRSSEDYSPDKMPRHIWGLDIMKGLLKPVSTSEPSEPIASKKDQIFPSPLLLNSVNHEIKSSLPEPIQTMDVTIDDSINDSLEEIHSKAHDIKPEEVHVDESRSSIWDILNSMRKEMTEQLVMNTDIIDLGNSNIWDVGPSKDINSIPSIQVEMENIETTPAVEEAPADTDVAISDVPNTADQVENNLHIVDGEQEAVDANDDDPGLSIAEIIELVERGNRNEDVPNFGVDSQLANIEYEDEDVFNPEETESLDLSNEINNSEGKDEQSLTNDVEKDSQRDDTNLNYKENVSDGKDNPQNVNGNEAPDDEQSNMASSETEDDAANSEDDAANSDDDQVDEEKEDKKHVNELNDLPCLQTRSQVEKRVLSEKMKEQMGARQTRSGRLSSPDSLPSPKPSHKKKYVPNERKSNPVPQKTTPPSHNSKPTKPINKVSTKTEDVKEEHRLASSPDSSEAKPVKRGRGRPRKVVVEDKSNEKSGGHDDDDDDDEDDDSEEEQPEKRTTRMTLAVAKANKIRVTRSKANSVPFLASNRSVDRSHSTSAKHRPTSTPKNTLGSPKLTSLSRGGFGSPKLTSPSKGGPGRPKLTSPNRGGPGRPKLTSPSRGGFGRPKLTSPSRGGVGRPKLTSPSRGGVGRPRLTSPSREGLRGGAANNAKSDERLPRTRHSMEGKKGIIK